MNIDKSKHDKLSEILKEVYGTILRNLPDHRSRHDDISYQSYLMECLLAESYINGDRDGLRKVVQKLDYLSARAFLEEESPRNEWILADWGQRWEAFADLARIWLGLDRDGIEKEAVAYVNKDETRKAYILAFLDDDGSGSPVSRANGKIAELVGNALKSEEPKSNTVFNRLARFKEKGLVQRSGPVQGWYELTRKGREVANEIAISKREKTDVTRQDSSQEFLRTSAANDEVSENAVSQVNA